MPTEKIMLSAHVAPADVATLDSIQDYFRHLNRHLVLIAAIRAGSEVLERNPERVPGLIADQRFAHRVEPRGRRPLRRARTHKGT